MNYVMIMIVTVMLGLASPVQAEETCENRVVLDVHGLVCDFCARAFEKVFMIKHEVENITVDLNESTVTVMLKPEQTMDDATITTLVEDAGYDVAKIARGC